jgi:dipeptidyl aminopeptidase/acylaminoacyl peptidase
MIRKLFLTSITSVAIIIIASSQEALKYQLPPDEIVRIVDAPVTPLISVSPDKTTIVLIDRAPIITIKELSAGELRLGGIRINPATNGPSRQTFNKSFRLINIDGTNTSEISGLPASASLSFPQWSPDGKKFAFTNTSEASIELWICDVSGKNAFKVSDDINMVFRNMISWMSDNSSIVFCATDPDRGLKPVKDPVPIGPVVQENLGTAGEARTYQDLLQDPADETLFEYYTKSQLMLWDGNMLKKLGKPAIITSVNSSPDGNFLLVTIVDRPFSYMVPYYSFPSVTQIWDIQGNIIKTLNKKPLAENEPRGYDMVLPGPRFYSWRSDTPASVYWVEALDDGDFSKKMEYHDQVYFLEAPFTGNPVKLVATSLRFSGIEWGRNDFAIITESSSKTRIRITNSFNPGQPMSVKMKIHELNRDDRYNDPGRYLTDLNSYGKEVLLFADRGRSLILSGTGASPEGDRPFIDKYNIITGKTTRLWRSEAPFYETVSEVIDITKGLVLTNRQSVTEVPNYFIRNLRTDKLSQVTYFENPYPQMVGVYKELVKYKRNDGLDLSFTLYLPEGFEIGRDKPLPTLLWAYPREFNDPSAAGQVSGSPFSFTRISPSSALVYVTQGYAILMDASFPIVGVKGQEPNNTFVEQLVANADAAIDKAVEMGITDRERVAVSGHSYGAFMTANLLSHSRLFAAGIAESGAYNRTLTPFGFQNERRSYWEAPEIYNRMSPFMNADKVKDPILLIHGMADNNSGTFPIQSERYFAALKGFGAITRLVMLPYESHGYAARESILHKHWEVLSWMDKYVKNRKN